MYETKQVSWLFWNCGSLVYMTQNKTLFSKTNAKSFLLLVDMTHG